MILIRHLLCAMVLAAVVSLPALGDVIEVRNFTFEQGEEALTVNADFGVDLSSRLDEALNNGVALHFVVEFELIRPRWYWFDERSAFERLQLRLSYHPLSRQYRVSRGALFQNFFSLSEALRSIGTIRGWQVVEHERLRPEKNYVATLRMRLDTSQLPKPFQVSALTNREWTLESQWKRVSFTSGERQQK